MQQAQEFGQQGVVIRVLPGDPVAMIQQGQGVAIRQRLQQAA